MDAVEDEIDGQAKPLVGVVHQGRQGHAVTFIGKDGSDYVFKNSYGSNNPKNPALIKIPDSRLPYDPKRIDLILKGLIFPHFSIMNNKKDKGLSETVTVGTARSVKTILNTILELLTIQIVKS